MSCTENAFEILGRIRALEDIDVGVKVLNCLRQSTVFMWKMSRMLLEAQVWMHLDFVGRMLATFVLSMDGGFYGVPNSEALGCGCCVTVPSRRLAVSLYNSKSHTSHEDYQRTAYCPSIHQKFSWPSCIFSAAVIQCSSGAVALVLIWNSFWSSIWKT